MTITIVRILSNDNKTPDDVRFIHQSFEDVVDYFKQGSLNSVFNEVEGYANITHEIRDEKNGYVNRHIRIERLIA